MLKQFFFGCALAQVFLLARIDLDFVIDENYLIAHTLASACNNSFSSNQNRDSIVAFQNEVWDKNTIGYQLLPCSFFLNPKLSHHASLDDFMAFAKSLTSFQPVLTQTHAYQRQCEKLWNETYDRVSQYVSTITGLELDDRFKIFLTHPSLRNGKYVGDHEIAWGCSGDFAYYDVVYLWHEILFAYLPNSDIAHCVIQLVTDNGIRLLLNESAKQFPLIGHRRLEPLMELLYPKWEEYLNWKKRDIFAFLQQLQELPEFKDHF